MDCQLVAFDLVGTLIYPNPPVAEVYQRLGAAQGLHRDEPELRRRFKDAFRRAHFGRGTDLEHRALWRAIVEDVFGAEPETCATLFSDLWDHFASSGAWSVFEDVGPTLERLRSSGERFVIASNFDSRIEPILRGLDLWDDGAVFWSSALRASKPDRKFFHAIEEVTHVPAGDCLMVGDSLVNDVHGAIEAGWNASLIDRKRRSLGAEATADEGYRVIGSLEELVTDAASS